MFCADKTITLIRPTLGLDGETYECVMIHGASYYALVSLGATDNGFLSGKEVFIRIPKDNMPDGFKPQIGDYFVDGELSGLEGLHFLNDLSHCKVTAVHDNRRGNLAHWAVRGK